VNLLLWWILAAAPTTSQCRESYDSLQYRVAAETCAAAIAQAPQEQLLELYRLVAMSAAAVGDNATASSAFLSLLALDGSYQLPDSVSPRIRELLEQVRAKAGDAPVHLDVVPEGPAYVRRRVSIRVTVTDSRENPVKTFSASSPGGQSQADRLASPVLLQLPPAPQTPSLNVEVRALDAFGGALALTRLDIPLSEPPSVRPTALSWKLWAGVGTGLLALGTGFGVYSRVAQNNAVNASFADDTVRNVGLAKTSAGIANVSLIAGGAVAVGALVLLLTEPREAP
jgi:hypothetical protein